MTDISAVVVILVISANKRVTNYYQPVLLGHCNSAEICHNIKLDNLLTCIISEASNFPEMLLNKNTAQMNVKK